MVHVGYAGPPAGCSADSSTRCRRRRIVRRLLSLSIPHPPPPEAGLPARAGTSRSERCYSSSTRIFERSAFRAGGAGVAVDRSGLGLGRIPAQGRTRRCAPNRASWSHPVAHRRSRRRPRHHPHHERSRDERAQSRSDKRQGRRRSARLRCSSPHRQSTTRPGPRFTPRVGNRTHGS